MCLPTNAISSSVYEDQVSNLKENSSPQILAHLSDAGSVVNITISDPRLEEMIAKIYQTHTSR